MPVVLLQVLSSPLTAWSSQALTQQWPSVSQLQQQAVLSTPQVAPQQSLLQWVAQQLVVPQQVVQRMVAPPQEVQQAVELKLVVP